MSSIHRCSGSPSEPEPASEDAFQWPSTGQMAGCTGCASGIWSRSSFSVLLSAGLWWTPWRYDFPVQPAPAFAQHSRRGSITQLDQSFNVGISAYFQKSFPKTVPFWILTTLYKWGGWCSCDNCLQVWMKDTTGGLSKHNWLDTRRYMISTHTPLHHMEYEPN